jgi:hypothetical protein
LVEERVGRTLFVAPSEAALFVDGSVEAVADGGFAVQLQVSDRAGQVLGMRSLHFEGSDCAAVAAPVALIIAVTLYPDSGLTAATTPLDPELAARLSELFDRESSAPDPAATPPVAQPPAASEAAPQPQPLAAAPTPAIVEPPFEETLAIGVSGVAGLGTIPSPGLALGLRATLRLDQRWVFEAGIDRYFAKQTRVRDLGRIEFGLLEGALAVCPWPLLHNDVRMCAGAMLGVLTAEPSGFLGGGDTRSQWIVSARLNAVYRPRLSERIAARLALGIALPFFQRAYTVQGSDGLPIEAFRMSQVTGQAEAGISASF